MDESKKEYTFEYHYDEENKTILLNRVNQDNGS